MFVRGIFAAFAALVFSAVLVGNAEAYPTTARSGTTTVTGLYRPLELNLSLTDGTDALTYCAGCFGGGASYFNYTATYNGMYSGYGPGGAAGDWELSLSYFGSGGVTDDGTTITLTQSNLANSVGRLTYLGGGDYTGVPYADTPQVDDFFRLYATSTDPFLQVTCADGVATCTSFVVQLLQDLEHLGPFVYDGGEGSFLDDGTGFVCDIYGANCVPRPDTRVNQACIDAPNGRCGTIPASSFRVSSVPEPASLALVGLGLAGIALLRRKRQRPV